MKKVILGLILIGSWQVMADNGYASLISSGSQIAAAWMLPNYGVGPDIKFGLYFSAGLDYPLTTACVLLPLSYYTGDLVAFSTGLSLINRGIAKTILNETFGVNKDEGFMLAIAIDQIFGKIPGFEKFEQTKWMGAVGNTLENMPTIGPLMGGAAMAMIPISGNFDQTASSEFSEESGMRFLPEILKWLFLEKTPETYATTSAILAASSFWVSYKLKVNHPLKSSWMGSAAMSFMMNVLGYASQRLHQMIDND